MLFNRDKRVHRDKQFSPCYALLLVMLSGGCLPTLCGAQAQQPPPVKPKTEPGKTDPKTVPTGKASPGQKPSKTDAPAMPLKPGMEAFGATRPGGVGPLAVPAGPKMTAEAWEKKGQEALSARKFDDAIAAFKEAVALKSASAVAWYGLGIAYEAKKQYPEEARAFQILANLTPTNAQSYVFLANALLQSNQDEAALRALDRAIELKPDSPELYIQQGGVYLQQKETRRARGAFLQALGSAPDSPSAHASMGDAYEQEGRHREAVEEYEAALRSNANYLPAKLGRATSLAGAGKLREAEDLLGKMNGELEIAGTQLRAKLAAPGNDARTTAQLQVQIALIPTQQASTLTTLAQILDTPQRREDAIKAYQAALKFTPDNATIWGNLGWSQYEAGQYDAAIQNSRKALELDASLAYVRLNLGLTYATQNNWNEALKEYRQAVAVSTPTDIEAGIKDVRDAQSKQPASSALQQALTFLSTALEKANRAIPKTG